MKQKSSWNTFTKVHLGMTAVFALFGVIYLLIDSESAKLAAYLFILSAHALISTWMYAKFPSQADNSSHMTIFLKNIRSAILIAYTVYALSSYYQQKINTYLLVVIAAAVIAFTYLAIKAFIAFLDDLKEEKRRAEKNIRTKKSRR